MKEYIKKFWTTLLGGFVFGIALAVLLGIPIRFVVSLAIFLFILNTIIEQAEGYGTVTNLVKKVFAFAVGVIIFVGLRAIAGYLLDLPADRTHQDLVSGSGIWGITTRSITTNIVFEILFLIPGAAIAYLVVKEGRFWKTALVITCTVLLCWVAWTIKQRAHAEAMKRQSQALVSLNARGLNNRALINEAAATTSFGVAKAKVGLFYQQDGTNGFVLDQNLRNWSVLPGARVKQLHPDALPIVFEGEAFTQVMLPNTNGSFVGGTKTWVESWKFDWVDGRNAANPNHSLARRQVQEKIVHFKSGEIVYTGLQIEPGDKVRYLNSTKPFKELGKGGLHDVDVRADHTASASGSIVIAGGAEEGEVKIVVTPRI
ncbi:MAG: hypothetical protein UU95_C0039G0011 [Parcubacteria group bacterium GW2011_GWC2_42_12]|uniref:Uncharacterized protein n=1 Tax=Candidatus Falkowbacteria bacterium GW2011_GWA2_41_14 TaxID=1618635 RepID=A0A0G0XVI7_9BACT|nr:MAG: hypothetical protein UU43_C0001G0132 [Candidatus Falkowbacteria bacterium GW2011_GWA2_41_14]KKS33144.1 MAG: hypothetical protein UU95_C0039G0011 [Parcubacteria group bacterium GW2011_GWC2_42_12]